jgi:hypothetical protein
MTLTIISLLYALKVKAEIMHSLLPRRISN